LHLQLQHTFARENGLRRWTVRSQVMILALSRMTERKEGVDFTKQIIIIIIIAITFRPSVAYDPDRVQK